MKLRIALINIGIRDKWHVIVISDRFKNTFNELGGLLPLGYALLLIKSLLALTYSFKSPS